MGFLLLVFIVHYLVNSVKNVLFQQSPSLRLTTIRVPLDLLIYFQGTRLWRSEIYSSTDPCNSLYQCLLKLATTCLIPMIIIVPNCGTSSSSDIEQCLSVTKYFLEA